MDADIAFVGDSLTSRCQFGEFFRDKVVINRGIGSDTSEGLLHRIENIVSCRPNAMFVMIGVNDLGDGVAVEEITHNVQTFIQGLDAAIPDCAVYLISVLPVAARGLETLAAIERLNEQYEALCQIQGVTYVDLYPLYMTDGEVNAALYAADGVHLNGSGYRIWVDEISPYIQ